MASRFWVGGTGNLDGSTTTHISATSNGAGGASYPVSGDSLTFDGSSGGGTVTCTAALNLGVGDLTMGAFTGSFLGNGQTITCAQFSITGSATRTVNLTNCTVTCVQWTATTTTGLTFVSTGSSLTVTSPTASFVGGSLSYGSVTMAPSAGGNGPNLNTACTYVNLTLVGPAVKNASISINATHTVTGTLTIGGNTTQGMNRLVVASNTRGTQRAFACAGAAAVISGDVDFMDIDITGSPSWTNSGSKFVGDCGGNGSLITSNITTPATQTYSAGAGNWSTAASWTSRAPLPQDNVVVSTGATGTVTIDMPRIGKDIDFTGLIRQITWAACELYGSLTFGVGQTNSGTTITTLAGRGSHTLTFATKTPGTPYIANGPGGTYALQDAFDGVTGGGTGVFTITGGTFNTGAQTMTVNTVVINNALASIAGTGTINLSSTAATNIWNLTAGSVTFTGAVVVNSTSANTRTFVGGGKTYDTLSYTIAGSTGQLTITGANTFATINFSDVTNARTLAFTINTTTTITNTLNVVGTSGKNMSIVSTTGGTTATISKIGNLVSTDYLTVTDVVGAGVVPFYGGANSNGTGTFTNWTFSVPPSFYVGLSGMRPTSLRQSNNRSASF